jgi:hypothetical protein
MNHFCLSIFVGVGLVFLAQPASAQSPSSKAKAALNNSANKDKSEAKAEADRVAKERRAQARSLLISLASDARSFHDQTLRARSLARIADTLWSVDAEQGRTLFRKAWEAAETGDRENQERFVNGQWPPNLRGEVLKLVARRDRLLAEEFLEKLKADQQEPKAEHSETDPWRLAEAAEQRLGLARGLLRTGDIDHALEFADPVLGSITMSTVDFLSELRDKDPTAADRRYASMLATTNTNMAADANSISLLSSYIFTPHLYVIASGYTMPSSYSPPASVGQQLRLAFFQAAAGVLLRPQTPVEKNQSTLEMAAKYMVVKRLMPMFEQYAPAEITEAMRSQFQALTTQVNDDVRQEENEWLQKGIIPEKPLEDQEQPLLDQIEHARTSNERDGLYVKLALLALSKDDLKARDYVSKIDHTEYRKRVQAWVDACLAVNAIKKKKTETALALARTGELTHLQRLWIFTEAAKLLTKTDCDKAISLLDAATAEAGRIEGVDLDRPRGLLAIANALKLFEPSRAWDAAFDAVKAANSTDGFTGEDGVLNLGLGPQVSIGNKTYAAPDFDVEGIFTNLATDDYDRAVQLARGFQGEAPRANATIAIARSVLNEKNASVPKPQPTTKK